MKYPLISDLSTYFPEDGLCPWCRRQRVLEPHTFVALIGGGLLMNREKGCGGPSDVIDGFLDLAWHEAHSSDEEGNGCGFPIAQDVRGGQFGIYCCSVRCLRKLLNRLLDDFDQAIQDASNESEDKEQA